VQEIPQHFEGGFWNRGWLGRVGRVEIESSDLFSGLCHFYVSPLNPVDEYGKLELTEEMHLGVAAARLVVTGIDRAAEAIRVLNETRELWSTTWDEVKPIPASLQIPFFDVATQSTLTLDS
jgi:hypothetical protein